MKIVVFEDDKDLRFLFKQLLELHGHEVKAYPCPSSCSLYRDSCSACSKASPCADVIIADIRMPHMGGDELFRRQSERGCKAPAENRALMTAAVNSDRKALSADLGCHVIAKPFKMQEIIKWLGECAERVPAPSPVNPV